MSSTRHDVIQRETRNNDPIDTENSQQDEILNPNFHEERREESFVSEDDLPLRDLMDRIHSRNTQTFTTVTWDQREEAKEIAHEPTSEEKHAFDVHKGKIQMPVPVSSPTDILLMKMAESLGEILKEVNKKPVAPQNPRWFTTNRGIPYVYAGADHEDPNWFLEKMQQYFHDAQINEDIEKINLLGEQLRGKARKWYETNLPLATGYQEMVQLFRQKFDSPEERAEVYARLYGDKQQNYEKAAAFISKKRRMAERLIPTTPFSVISSIVINQLDPELRSRLRAEKFHTYEELIRITSQIETDLEEVRKNQNRQRNSVTPQVTTSEDRSLLSSRGPVQNGNHQISNQPPSACRFCGEWHFHSQCPRNVYRQQGNEDRAERSQPSDPHSARINPQNPTSRNNTQNPQRTQHPPRN